MIEGLAEFFTNGCGPFWIANSITSTFMGEKNRDMQAKIADENETFQRTLQKQQQLSQEEMERERIKFRRHLMDLTRQWQREERAQAALNMDIHSELPHFVNQWPLALLPDTILSEIRHRQEQPLNVILLHTPLIAGMKGQIMRRETPILIREKDVYNRLEFNINNNMPILGDVCFRQAADSFPIDLVTMKPVPPLTSADIMNVHFLMGSIPTLVLIPKYQDERISLSIAMWDEQASRPYIRPLFAMPHNPILARDNEKYLDEVIEKLHYSVSIITGAIRDQYALLTWGKQPTLNALLEAKGNERMKLFAQQNRAIKEYLLQENTSTLKALETANNPKLLEVYEQADIDNMKGQLSIQRKLYNLK